MRTEMDRNRDVRRTTIAATNGLSRRRHRTNSLRDSPEEDGVFELQESGRLRDRKKDRDRERDRDRDRLIRKRRRGDMLMHGNSNREDGGDDSSAEGVNDEEDEDDDVGGDIVGGGSGSMRMLLPNPPSMFSSSSLLNQRRSFPPATKSFSAAPTWKADEMIGVSVPRKARSASTKRSHEWASCPGIIGDSNYRQASTSPVRPSPTTVVASSSSPAPVSPSGSNISMKKKLKHSGSKFRPPKTTSSKSSSSAQDEIEIEIAEVLYGMMRQPQGSTKQENLATDSIKFEAREVNKSTTDAKSIVSSPISSSQSTIHLSSITLPQNSSSSVAPMSIVAPKRKRPRPLKYDDESPSVLTHQNSLISATSKVGADQSSKTETCSPIMDKDPGSAVENGEISYRLGQSHAVSLPVSTTTQPQPESIESSVVSGPKTVTQKTKNENMGTSMEEPQSPKKELVLTRLDDTKENSRSSKAENQREDMFKIDLMAPPPQRSLPERNSEVDNVAVDSKPTVTDKKTDKEPMINEESKIGKNLKQEAANVEPEKINAMVEENELKMSSIGQETNIDLEKPDNRESVHARVSGNNLNKLQQHVAKQPLQLPTNTEKSAQSNSLPLPTSMAAWPGGLPPLGYMAPLQGPVSIDGSTVASAAIQPPTYLFSQPRAKRCATHCYIARNICYHQQILKSNSFWPATAAGSAPLYGATHLPSMEFHANISGRGVNSGPDKGQGPAIFSALLGMDKGAQAANIVDAAQRKQLLLQQTLPPGAPSNILHGPAFIFPFGQQQAAAAAACVRPGSVKSLTPGCISSSTTPKAMSATAPAMSFNYPNVHGNETQYLVLQNNAYPFPIPSHVGAPPAYRGPHAPAIPFFNGSFYSSQILHPSQMQQQQQPSHSQQSQQGHQNTSISSGSTSSQKHLQNDQLRPHASGINDGTGSLQAFSSPKNQSTQPMQVHSRQQQQQNQHAPHLARQLESEMGSKDIPSTDDGRATCGAMSIYGHNFAMPMHAPNFLMTPAPFSGTGSTSVASGNNNSQKQQLQQHGSKGLVETSQAFGMSFASNNGSTTTAGFDVASIAHHPAILQSIADVRQGYHFMAAAAQAAHQKKTFNVPEEKNGGDCSNGGEEGKNMAGKEFAVRQSIASTRPDLTDAVGSTISGKTVIDSSARSLKLVSTSACASDSVIPATLSGVNASRAQQQQQQMQQNHQHQQQQQMQQNHQHQQQQQMQQNHQHQQQQQMQQNHQHQMQQNHQHQQHQMQQNHQHQQQQMQQNQQQQQQMQRYQQQQIIQQQLAAAARTKTPTTSNGSVYPDHLPSTSMAAKFPNAISSFSQNLLQGNSSPVQSPQWKNSPRTNHSSQTPSMASSSSLKSLPQQGRPQQGYTQISFAANPKPSTQGQGVQPASSNQSPSPVMVGSPTTSSVSKSTGGSPRTTTTSTSIVNKTCQASMLSSQQAKNSSASSLKSSPGGSNVSSILGNPHITSSMSILGKSQQQQQISKQSIQQAQLYFSSAYMQTSVPNSNSTTSAAATSAYYHQRRWSEQQQQQQSSSSGISNTSDPAKAAAAAMKAGGLHSQTIIHPAQFAAGQSGSRHQLMPYVHAVPTAAQVKPTEQKQPAGE